MKIYRGSVIDRALFLTEEPYGKDCACELETEDVLLQSSDVFLGIRPCFHHF